MTNVQTTAENRKEYFLTLAISIVFTDQIEEIRTVYSVQIGELTPGEAKAVDEYAQGFKWADTNCAPELKKTLVRNATNVEQVIFTDDSNDACFIELHGRCLRWRKFDSFTGDKPFRVKLSVDLPKSADLNVLDEASSHFKNDEELQVTRLKITRDIMKLCVKKAEELRENPMQTESAKTAKGMKVWIRNGAILSGVLIIAGVLVPAVAYIMGSIVLGVVIVVLGAAACKYLGITQ